MDVKQSKPSLEIEPALVDGFLVREVYDGTGDSPGVLFAGTLSHCLAFMESRMPPPQAIYTPDPVEGVTGAGKVHHSTDIDWSGVKSPTVSLEELEAERKAQAEWDEGVVAATRAGGWTGNRWPDGRKTYPPETGAAADRAYREALISTVSREGPALAVWLTPHDRATIITALRQQDAQNAGRIEKDFK